MPRKDLPPVLLGELRRAGVPVFVKCPCFRMVSIDPASIPLPDDADMNRVGHALKCTVCGRSGGISASPEPAPWVRHLRRTGERDRLPWYAAMIRDHDD